MKCKYKNKKEVLFIAFYIRKGGMGNTVGAVGRLTQENEPDFIFFDLPETFNTKGVVKTPLTETEPVAEPARQRTGQTAGRLTVATDKCIAGCISRNKTIQITGGLSVQHTGCTFLPAIKQADKQPYRCTVNRANGQLTALAATSIINSIKMFK